MRDFPELVEQVKAGDPQSMQELVERFKDMAVHYAWSLTGDYPMAQDLAQEAFIKVLRNIGMLKNPAAFPKWFKTVLHFTCLRTMKAERRHRPLESPPSLAEPDARPQRTTEEVYIEQEQCQSLWDAINRYDATDRSILVLRYVTHYTYQEIADAMGISAVKVNNRLHALKQSLKKELADVERGLPTTPAEFTRNVVEGVQKLALFPDSGAPMLTHFCGSLAVLLRAIGADQQLDYTHVVAASGAAFRMIWKRGWYYGNEGFAAAHNDRFALVRWGPAACGCKALIRLNAGHEGGKTGRVSKGMAYVDESTARREIVKSIDAGMPVLAIGVLQAPEFCVVTGYDDAGATLLGWHYWQDELPKTDDFEIDAGGYFRKRNWFATTWGYVLIKEIKPVAITREFCLHVVRRAVEMERTYQVQGNAGGLEAFRAWADQLLKEDLFAEGEDSTNIPPLKDKFIIYLDNHCMLNERRNGAAFLERMAERCPEFAGRLHAAAGYYRKAADYAGAMWKYVSFEPEGMARFTDPDTRAVLAAHILKARTWEEKAVACLEALLEDAQPGKQH